MKLALEAQDIEMHHVEPNQLVRDQYKLKRIPERGTYSTQEICAIIDGSYLCHVSFMLDGKPTAIPLVCWRQANHLYIHSANKGRLSKLLVGAEVCVTIALFDGLVLGHSAFNHSYNYRSVVIHGKVEEIADHVQKTESMQAFMDHVLPGRWEQIRPVKEHEIRSITVMRISLDQAVGKVRDEFPDEESDSPDWPAWIGVIPAKTVFLAPIPDQKRNKISTVPKNIAAYESIDFYQPRFEKIK